jgi:tetratricopeptide (TPR) repeat protein
MAALLALVTVLAYQPVWHAGFIFDDDGFLVDNPLIKAGDGLYQFWCTTAAPDYFPLTSTTLWLEWRLWGNQPLGYHLVNVLLHAASAVLLWRVLARLKLPGAWLAAAMFALHPVNVESVAWITERKNTLAMFFYAWALLWYLRFDQESKVQCLKSKVSSQESGGTSQNRPSRSTSHASRFTFHALFPLPSSLFYSLSLFAFVLALLSKTAVAPLPLVLLGLAWWQRERIERRDVWRSSPFFGMAVVLGLITVWFQSHRAIGSEIVRADSLWGRLAGAGWAVWFYLYKALWPVKLMFVYPRWKIDASQALTYLPGLLGGAVLVVSWHYRRQWGRAVLLGLGYFVVMLLPALGFVNIYFMRYSLVSDHWQYFAIIGPIALMAAALTAGWERLGRAKAGLGAALGGALLVALGVLTWREARIYADKETLWRDTLAKNPACWLAYNNFGTALVARGQIDEAIRQFREALRLKPDDPLAHYNLGTALDKKGQIDEAIRQFQEALRLDPEDAETHINLGTALDKKGQFDEAIRHYQQALRLEPNVAEAHYNLGLALSEKGQIGEAIRQFEEAIRLEPDYAEAHNNFGKALGMKGQIDEAIGQFQETLRLKPDYADAHYNLGLALADKGRNDEAIGQFQEALRLKPDYAEADYNLGNALAQKGQMDEAIRQYEAAIRLKPGFVLAHNNLGYAHLNKGQTDEAMRQFQEALRLNPDNAETHNYLGAAFVRKAQTDAAIQQFQEALRLKPDHAEAHYNLGNALATKGQIDEALPQFEEALRLQPDYAEAHNNLGYVLLGKGQTDGAVRQFQEAVRLKPDYAEAHNNLGYVLLNKGQVDEAIRQLREALRLKPDYAEAHNNLARALEMKKPPAGR